MVLNGSTGVSNRAPTTDTAVAGKPRSPTKAVVMSLAVALGERGRVVAVGVARVNAPPRYAGGWSWERLSWSVGGSKGRVASHALDKVAFTRVNEGPG